MSKILTIARVFVHQDDEGTFPKIGTSQKHQVETFKFQQTNFFAK